VIRSGCVVLVAMLLVTGCASVPKESVTPGGKPDALWQARRTELEALTQWQLSGRVAIRTADSGTSANLRWEKEAQQTQIDLFGPFGGGKIRLWVDPVNAQLRDGQGRIFEAPSASQALFDATGWHIPFEALGYWIRGLPAPGEIRSMQTDARGALVTLSQAGWDIAYREYGAFGETVLPRKIRISAWPETVQALSTRGELAGDTLVVKLLLERWLGFASAAQTEQ